MTSRGTIQREQVYVRGNCERCNEADALVYECGEQLYCASCTREYIRENPRPQLCDKCGSEQMVFRDPSHRRNEYLCFGCHVEAGTKIRSTVVARAVRQLSENEK